MKNSEMLNLSQFKNDLHSKLDSKIIDAHAHIAFHKLYSPSFIYTMFPDIPPVDVSRKENYKQKKIIRLLLNDLYCNKLVQQMQHSGIKKAVLLLIDTNYGLPETVWPLKKIYSTAYAILKRYPRNFLLFAGIDPRRTQSAYKLFAEGIDSDRIKGLKLYPPLGYSILHPGLSAYYALCEKKSLPVVIHTGPSISCLSNAFDNPYDIMQLAGKFPKIKFILAHAGFRIDTFYTKLLSTHTNLYLDLSGYQVAFKTIDKNALDNLGKIFDPQFNKRIVFGSDWPLFNMFKSLKNNIDFILDVFLQLGHNQQETGILENIFYKNMEEILQENS